MKTRHASGDESYYTDRDVARLLGISIGRLRNKLTAGSPLPPRIQPPGCRRRLWSREAVHSWLDRFVVVSSDEGVNSRAPGRRGRPTKFEEKALR